MPLVTNPPAKDEEEKPLATTTADLQQEELSAMGDPTDKSKVPEVDESSKEEEIKNVGGGEENRADLTIGDTKTALFAANKEQGDIDASAGDVLPMEAEGKMAVAAKDVTAEDEGKVETLAYENEEKEQVGDAPMSESGGIEGQKSEKKSEQEEKEAERTEESETKTEEKEVSLLEEREREVAKLVQHAEDLEMKAIHLEEQASILDQAAEEMEREAITIEQRESLRNHDSTAEDPEPNSASSSPEEKHFDWDGMIADLETKLAAARDRVEESKEARNVARSKLKRWKAAELTAFSEESAESTAEVGEEDKEEGVFQEKSSETVASEGTEDGLKDDAVEEVGKTENPAPSEGLLRATFSQAKAKVSQAKMALIKAENKLRKAKKEHREPLEPQTVKRQKLDKKDQPIGLKQSPSRMHLDGDMTEAKALLTKPLGVQTKDNVNKAERGEGKPDGNKERDVEKNYVRLVEGGDVKIEQSATKVDKEPKGIEVDSKKRGRADGEKKGHHVQEAETKVAGKIAAGGEEPEGKPEASETTEPVLEEEPVEPTVQDDVGAPVEPTDKAEREDESAKAPEPGPRAPEVEPIASREQSSTSAGATDVAGRCELAPNVELLADKAEEGVAGAAEGEEEAVGGGGEVAGKEGGAAVVASVDVVPATQGDSSSSSEENDVTTALPGAAAAAGAADDEEEEEGPMLWLGAGPGLPLARFPVSRVIGEMAPRVAQLPAAFERVFGAEDEEDWWTDGVRAARAEDGPSTSGVPAPREDGGARATTELGDEERALTAKASSRRVQFAAPPPESQPSASAGTAITGLFQAPSAKRREEEEEEEDEDDEELQGGTGRGPRRLARRWSLEGPHQQPLPVPVLLQNYVGNNATSLPMLAAQALGRDSDAEDEVDDGGSLGTASTLSADGKAALASTSPPAPAAAPAEGGPAARPAAAPRSRWERWVRRVLRGLVPRDPHPHNAHAVVPAPVAAAAPRAAVQRSAPALALGLGAARRYPAGPPASAPATASAASVVPLGAAAGVAMAAGAGGLGLAVGAGPGAGPEPGSRNTYSLGRMAVFRARPPAALAERKKAKRDKEQQRQQQQQQQHGKESGRGSTESLGALAAMKKKSASLLRRTLGLKKESKGEQGRPKGEPGPSTSSACPAATASHLHVGFLEDDNMEDIQLDVPRNEVENSSSHAQMTRKPEKKGEDRDVNLNKTQADVHKEDSD